MGKRNPNGYGSVSRLSGNRSKPWVARVTICDNDGQRKQVPIGYAKTEAEGKILLAKYNENPWDISRDRITLADLYKQFLEIKGPKLSLATKRQLKTAYNHCSKYYYTPYRKIKSYHMQECIDGCGKGYSTQWAIKNLFNHLDKYAFEMDIIDKMYSGITTAAKIPDTKRVAFTQTQIDALWSLEAEPWVDSVLTFLYTGFRLNELLGLKCSDVDLDQMTICGGSKTDSGKNRIVPIHPRIQPLIYKRLQAPGDYLFSHSGKRCQQDVYYGIWRGVMSKIDTDKTPHECRHTFRSRLDSAGANKRCIDLLMGHKSKDVGERVYTHKTLEDLRQAIELLS